MRLKQVLLNYQSNALKFSKPGGSVLIKCNLIKGNPDTIEIKVTDTGFGISQQDIPKLFQLYGYL